MSLIAKLWLEFHFSNKQQMGKSDYQNIEDLSLQMVKEWYLRNSVNKFEDKLGILYSIHAKLSSIGRNWEMELLQQLDWTIHNP